MNERLDYHANVSLKMSKIKSTMVMKVETWDAYRMQLSLTRNYT
jgi:hypothetical protein